MMRCPMCRGIIHRPGPCDPCRARAVHPVAVHLVAGPPAGGKSTYVARRRAPGSLVVDLDAIAAALGSPGTHDHPADLVPFALDAYDAVVSRLGSARHRLAEAWVIRCAPTAGERAELARRLGARTVTVVAPPADVTLSRAVASGRPPHYPELIENWYSRWSPAPFDTLAEWAEPVS